jgi:hypothetical protein
LQSNWKRLVLIDPASLDEQHYNVALSISPVVHVDQPRPLLLRGYEDGLLGRMSNVIDLRSHPKHQHATTSAAERAAAIADLVALASGVREVVQRTIELSGPSQHQIEKAAQHLVDAHHQLEAAANVLAEDGQWVPF